MALIWRQWCGNRANDQHRLGVSALETGDVVGGLLHLRAAVRFDPNVQLRPETSEVYERAARLWYERAEVRDEIRRREDLARKPGQWLYEVTPPEASCCSYRPGHVTHWIAALRVYARAPRDAITLLDADDDGWLTFRDQESNELRWWHHEGSRVVALWRTGARFSRIRGSQFLVAQPEHEDVLAWKYCDGAPSPCVHVRSSDPVEAFANEEGS